MAKVKTAYVCQSCGSQTPKWVGKCNACGEWNTVVEEILSTNNKSTITSISDQKSTKPQLVSEVTENTETRFSLQDNELNRVLGGGIVPGSLTLIGGEPGIGKSTLMLQVALTFKQQAVYVSGEESAQQIKMRANRLGMNSDQCYLLTETSLENILLQLKQLSPALLVIDSIQTLHSSTVESAPGSVTQIRQCTAGLLEYAKTLNVPVFLIGHINKDGHIAGPKVLEHMVDTVLQFEGDRNHVYRLVRATKNRFGSTNELGIYEMKGDGLVEVTNPSDLLISQQGDNELSGIAVAATVEGLRPMLIEVQALVSSAVYGTPQRSGTGFDLRRLNMLLAVLEKRCGFKLATKDVFLNITGGIRVDDPAIDLAVVCAILSSGEDIPLPSHVCFAAEIGLSGEIRPVSKVEQRISEAEKLGFKTIVVSAKTKNLQAFSQHKIKVVGLAKVEDVVRILMA